MRLRTLGALVAVLCLLAIAGVRSDAAPKPGGTMKVALLRDPTGWDPHINYGATTYTFQANIYEGLLRYSLKGTLEPGLAVRWEMPNPTTYVLHLRKGVKFHSGNPFTADDVKWNIERIMAPATNATRAKEFEVVEAVTAVDPSTVRITLKQPAAPFLELLAAAEAVMADS
jgi:peptide/nickel transport system substrate-binding protein